MNDFFDRIVEEDKINPTFREGPPPEQPSRERVEAWIDGKLSEEEAAYVRWLVTCYREWNQLEQAVLLERVKAMSAQEYEEKTCSTEAKSQGVSDKEPTRNGVDAEQTDRRISEEWISVWNQTHNRHSLPLPSQAEAICLSALVRWRRPMPISTLFQEIGEHPAVSNIVQLQQVTEDAVIHGFLRCEKSEIESGVGTKEYAIRGEQDDESQLELAFQLAHPPEELLARVCQSYLEDETIINKEAKKNLLALADALKLTPSLRRSFKEWIENC